MSIGCVLLDVAMPLAAVAVAHARGVPVTSVCHLYGVVLPSLPVSPHHRSDSSHGPAHESLGVAPESHDHGSAQADLDGCPLRCMVILALGDLPDLRPMPRAPGNDSARAPERAPHHRPHDAVARWVSALAHAPPQQG